jgi:O-antigen/teichoic acid export membrane protein
VKSDSDLSAHRNLYGRMFALVSATLKNRFFLWNVFGNMGPLVFGLIAIPYVYGHSTREYIGFLTLIWAAIGYTGLFDFGLSRALFYFTSLGKTDRAIDIQGVVVKSALFALGIAAIINAVLYLLKEQVAAGLSLESRDQLHSLVIISASLPIYLITNMIRSSLEGMELFRQANIFKFAAYLSLFACPALLIALGDKSLAHVCLLYAIVRLAAGLYALATLVPHLRERRGFADRTAVSMRKVLGFGGWATVSSTISPLMVYGDRFAIAYFNGAAAIAIYALLQELIGKTILLSASYVTAIQPKLSYLPPADAAALYARENRNVVLLSIGVYAGCLLVSPLFVSFWLDVSITEVAFLASIMSIGFMFNSMAQAPLAYLLARGQPRRVAGAHAVEALLYFPFLIGTAMQYGVAGAAVVGVLRQIFDYGILSWQAQRKTV